MCECHLAELFAKAAKERDEAKASEQAAWRVAAEKAAEADKIMRNMCQAEDEVAAMRSRIGDMEISLQEERDALRQAEAEIAELRSRIEERRPGGVVRYEPEGVG